MNHLHLSRPLILSIAVVLCSVTSFITLTDCAHDNGAPPTIIATHPLSSLDSLVAEKLSRCRIVMLGDAYHAHGYYMRMVTDVLRSWLNGIERNPSNIRLPKKLFLVLEMDSVFQNRLNEFVATENVTPYLENALSVVMKYGGIEKCSTDNIAFLYGLRDLVLRINRINSTLHLGIELQIVGAESDPPADFRTIVTKGRDEFQKEVDRWFINERDRLSSAHVTKLLDEHPDFKAIVFYGSGHLTRGSKEGSPGSAENIDTANYFLAHYLDEAFGRENVAVFNNMARLWNDSSAVIQEMKPGKDSPDFLIFAQPTPPKPFPIFAVRSKTIYRYLLREINDHISDTDSVNREWLLIVKGILGYEFLRSYLTVESPDNVMIAELYKREGQRRYSVETNQKFERIGTALMNKFDAIKNIEQMVKWITILDSADTYFSSADIIWNLPSSQISSVKVISPIVKPPRLRPDPETLSKVNDELETYVFINLLLVCGAEERPGILTSLHQLTGQQYNSSYEWYNWWMRKYGNN